MIRGWIAFWDSRHTIYVNARHRELHYRCIAQDLLAYVPRDGDVLDYGCGEALSAELIAPPARHLILCEAAPNVHAVLSRRYAGLSSRIEVRRPDEVENLRDASFDLIIMHSVAQYISAKELDTLLMLFHRLLRSDGRLILGDVIPPHISALTDALALLRFAADNRFLGAAVFGLLRTLASPYWRLRSRLGLTRYTEPAIMAKLAAAGFSTRRITSIGHNPARMSFLASPSSG
jgi:SAM-dependent methyltransferase